MANFISEPKHPPTTHLWQFGDGCTPSDIRIALWNANGIRSVLAKGKLQEFLDHYQPDFLAINETKIDLLQYQKLSLHFQFHTKSQIHWNQYWNFCKVGAGYSGVAIFCKYKPLRAVEDFECSYLGLEGRCLTLEFDKFYIVTCYKPNSGSALERLKERVELYDLAFNAYVNSLRSSGKGVIIAGDLNVAHREIDLANPKKNEKNAGYTIQERESFQSLLDLGFVDTYRHLHPRTVQYTWWSMRHGARPKNIGWRIDYVLVSQSPSLAIKQANIYDHFTGSDHCPIDCLIGT